MVTVCNNINQKPYLKIISLLLFFLIFFCQCKSGSVTFYNRSSFKGTTGKEIKSRDIIDKDNTYEVYFILEEKEECIKISISSKIYDEIVGREKLLKTFFVVEKAVDISRFKDSKRKKILFSELGRNFDYSWNREREIVICSSQIDPIKKLNRDIYRIRFTTFRNKEYNYEINIFLNSKVDFKKQFPAGK